MIYNFIFHGSLGNNFGTSYLMEVSTICEGMNGLFSQIKGLKEYFDEHDFEIYKDNQSIDLVEMPMLLGGVKDIHFHPVVQGSGGGGGKSGAAKVVVGALIVVVAIYAAPLLAGAGPGAAFGGGVNLAATSAIGLSYGQIAMLGVSIALSGVSQMLAPSPSSTEMGGLEDKSDPSFLFDGPQNTYREGGPVPLVFGLVRVGSVAVSVSTRVEEI